MDEITEETEDFEVKIEEIEEAVALEVGEVQHSRLILHPLLQLRPPTTSGTQPPGTQTCPHPRSARSTGGPDLKRNGVIALWIVHGLIELCQDRTPIKIKTNEYLTGLT